MFGRDHSSFPVPNQTYQIVVLVAGVFEDAQLRFVPVDSVPGDRVADAPDMIGAGTAVPHAVLPVNAENAAVIDHFGVIGIFGATLNDNRFSGVIGVEPMACLVWGFFARAKAPSAGFC